jgi:hypothetical protein
MFFIFAPDVELCVDRLRFSITDPVSGILARFSSLPPKTRIAGRRREVLPISCAARSCPGNQRRKVRPVRASNDGHFFYFPMQKAILFI